MAEHDEHEDSLTATNARGRQLHVVVLGKHEYILAHAEKLLQQAGFHTTGFLDEEDAEDYIRMNPVDALLVGGGIDPHNRLRLAKLTRTELPLVKFIEHFGGPATIIAEVKAALAL